MVRNFLGKFPEYPEIVEFPESESLNQKYRKFGEEHQIQRKFPVRNFRKFALGIPREVILFSGEYSFALENVRNHTCFMRSN